MHTWSRSNDECLKIARELLIHEWERVRFLWVYGSRKQGSDLDLFAVLDQGEAPPYRADSFVDLGVVSHSEFDARCGFADPVVTEPVLTGELLWGDRLSAHSVFRALMTSPVNEESVQELRTQARTMWGYAHEFFCRFARDDASHSPLAGQTNLRLTLADLTFAFSYDAFARHYAQRPNGAVTLRDVMRRQRSAFLSSSLALLKATRKGHRLDPFRVWGLLDQAHTFLTDGRYHASQIRERKEGKSREHVLHAAV
jgi:hypothetical protein